MIFSDFISAHAALLWGTFAIAVVMGAVVNKSNFCTMGAVSDLVNMGDNGRMRAWFLAAAIAILGVTLLESIGMANPNESFPPYRGSTIVWFENILGGLLFGIGMTLASGCGNKTLIRIGGGNIKSIFVLIIISVIAYFMVNPFPDSDQTLMSLLFIDWTRPLSLSLTTKQDLASVFGLDSIRLWVGLVVGLLIAVYALRSTELRGSFDNLLGGIVVGLCVVAFWYVSSTVTVYIETEETNYSLSGYYEEWDMIADSDKGKPAAGRPLNPQSFTFINPMGQAGGYLASGFNSKLLTAGLMALFGVIAGSFLWSILTKSFRIEWFNSVSDVVNHVIGAVLMGFGGVLAMGCTIGQGITGVSTLAIGSFITLLSIIFGSALTMKINYYKLVYEDEATFFKALVAALCDMKMLPNGMRKLEAV